MSRRPLIVLAAVAAAAITRPAAGAAELEFFEKRVRPILVQRCYECHAESTGKRKGGLVLDSRAGWEKGGDSGPVLVPGKPDESRLVRAVRYGGDTEMPPAGKLPAAEIAALERWVAMGAPDPRTGPAADRSKGPSAGELDHWAWRPIARPAPPAVADAGWARGPIDRFVPARLEAAGLAPAPEADRRTFIRRATFDLLGLPPTPDEVEAFVADARPDAFERLVDQLLASPHHGERWGRAWLDPARYADTNGVGENLVHEHAFRYRDWVVRALNEDLPYDQFLRQQLAGDLLPAPADPRRRWDPVIATGFLVLGPKMVAEQDKEKLVMDVVDDQIDVLGKTVLGLTLGCARCHDHKFDPVSTAEYHGLAGIFRSTVSFANLDHVSAWNERELATPAEIAAAEAHEARIDERRAALEDLAEEARRARALLLRERLAATLLAAARGGPDAPPLVAHVAAHLGKPERSREPIWAPWLALAALPDERFAAGRPRSSRRCASACRRRSAASSTGCRRSRCASWLAATPPCWWWSATTGRSGGSPPATESSARA